MINKVFIRNALILISIAAVIAACGPHPHHGPRPNFETIDTNGDGVITQEEFQAAKPQRPERNANATSAAGQAPNQSAN